jgi:hypothetical protein
MIRTLSIVTVAAFFLSVVCLSVAISMAGPDLIAEGFWSPWDRHGVTWSHTVDYHGLSSTRTLAWDGGERLEVDIPADVRFSQAEGAPSVTVSGPREVIDHVVLKDGRLHWEGRSYESGHGVEVQLTAPKVTRFELNGGGDLDIHSYRQDQLSIRNNGSGDVRASGTAKTVDLDLAGSGEADLADLATDGAHVSLKGSGDATVAPKSWAKLEVLGSGDVTLTTRPKQLQSEVTGSGHVEQPDGSDDSSSDSD